MSIQAKRNALCGLAVLLALGLLVFVSETAQVNAQRYAVEGSKERGVRSDAALAQSSSLFLFWEEDFDSISSSTYYITATSGSGVVSNESFLLTQNAGNQRGRIFYLTPTLMSEFTATFRLYLGNYEGGADGVAFIFCPSYDYPPGIGGGSLDAPCPDGYLVAFDTWGPPSDQVYVAFESTAEDDRLAVSDVPQLEDGAWHTAGVDFRGGTITVTLDGSRVITGVTLPGYDPFIGYFGFSGATGGAINEQRVDDVQVYAAPLFLAKTADPTLLDPGDPLIYTLTFINSHPTITATDVLITDIVPIYLTNYTYTYTGALITPTGSADYVWQVEDLAPGTGGIITVTGLLSTSLLPAQTFTNTARLSGVFSDVLMTYSASAAVTRRGADLAVGKTDALDPVLAGERLTYTLTITNHGPSTAGGSTWPDAWKYAAITIPAFGAATPYPSTIAVSGLPGGIIKATVTLNDVNHTWPNDMDVLLVGPGGQSVLLMSDAGGGGGSPLNNVRLTFDDAAPGPLPLEGQITSGDYQPTNYEGFDPDTFSAPAPAGPYGTALSAFDGTDPNGTWSLYVMDDMDNGPVDGGSIAYLGLSLNLVTGSSGTLTDVLPGGATFLSASPGCHDTGGGVITCTVGGLPSGASTEITIAVTAPGTGGAITNNVSVAGVLGDPEPSNNTASESTWVSAEADLAVDKSAWPDPVLAGEWLTYTFVITNNGPDWAIGVVLTDALPAGVSYDLALLLHLDEASGATRFDDASGRGNHGTCSGDACPTAGLSGRYGQAAQFDGADDYVDVAIDVSETAYALSLWFKTSCANCGILSVDDGTRGINGHDRHVYLSGGNLCTRVWDNETICTLGTDYADDGWHHVVHTFGGSVGGQRIYVDGALRQSGAKAASDFHWQTGVNVGFSNDAANDYFAGLIDQVVIYDRVLTELEVVALYQNGFIGLTCDLGVMPPGAVATVTLPVRVSSAQTETLTNTAYVSGDVPDSTPGNNDDDQSTQVQIQADLAVGKQVDPDPGLMGFPITYTMTISNSGPSDARNVLLTDTLQGAVTWGAITPSQGICGAPSGGSFTCTLGTISGIHRAQVTLVVTPSAAGRLTNTVRVAGDEFDPLTGNDVFTHTVDISEIDLALAKSADPTYLSEGDDVTYTLRLINNGPVPASGVVVSDTPPGGINVTGSGASHGSYASPGWDVGGLAVGEVATLTIAGTVGAGTAAQVLVNTAVLSVSTPLDIITRNNAASADIQVAGADLALSKSVDDVPDGGSTLIYEVQVTNLGPDDTTGVVVSDTLPLGVTFLSSSTTQGDYNATSGAWTVGPLNLDDSATLHITATVDAGTLGASVNITNTAVISASDQPDSLTANDAASATISVTHGHTVYLPLVLRDS